MEIDEKTLRKLIREEVWAAMSIVEKISTFAGIDGPQKYRHYCSAEEVLAVLRKAGPDGMYTKDVAADMGLNKQMQRRNVSFHLNKLYRGGRIARFGERGGDGYLYKAI